MHGTPHIVSDVMTHTVTAIGRKATFKEIVRLMQDWKVSALPAREPDTHASQPDACPASVEPIGRTPGARDCRSTPSPRHRQQSHSSRWTHRSVGCRCRRSNALWPPLGRTPARWPNLASRSAHCAPSRPTPASAPPGHAAPCRPRPAPRPRRQRPRRRRQSPRSPERSTPRPRRCAVAADFAATATPESSYALPSASITPPHRHNQPEYGMEGLTS
ncbi:hypothetical protein C4B68_01570 [Streptomyces dengpaensis]|uniref:CBS domain-containing protein n=1 Tax=Streptomyces dengpaensis TaxID=2049881 RepID=A0ABN5HUA5_9ACTN|nr:hypothetical protein C4B68_01570 [Streptomyces dengpaensis]PIB04192.1 hypothetical protein B1C81_34065 [Streptomyces sp. HG99]